MPKIDTSSWGEFVVSDVCCVLKGRKKLSNINITDLGSTPVYSSTTENNGIIGYTEESPDYVIDTDTSFYIIFGDHTKSMYIATNDFCVMDNVKVLVPKVYNKYAMQFVLASWQKSIPTLGYSRHWSAAKKAIFKLPIDTQGKPDWQYMEDYMRNIEVRVSDSISKLESAQGVENSKIDTSSWGEFVVGSLFDADRGKVKSLQTLKDGNTPVIAAARANQGVAGYYNVQAIFENKITVSCNGACGSTFYHPYKFNINGDAIVLTELKPMSDNVKQFIACVLDGVLTRKYSYNEKCSADKAKAEIIKLPIDSNGEPDWQYMEEYMKNIESKVKRKIDMLIQI
jgi:hypothetical protein